MNWRKTFQWSGAFLLYAFSFGLALQEGLYWDDWSIIHTPREGIKSEFFDSGYITFYLFLQTIWPITFTKAFLMKMIIFICYFISGVVIYYILLNIRSLRNAAFLVTLIILLIPFNHARASFAVINYVYNLTLFWIAFALLVYYQTSGNHQIKYLSLLLFFLSFNMNTVFVYFLSVVVYIFYFESVALKQVSAGKLLLKYSAFIIVCLLFLMVKYLFFPDKGVYHGYNAININSLLLSPLNSLNYIIIAYTDFANEAAHFIVNYPVLMTISSVMVYVYLQLIKPFPVHISSKPFLTAGVLLTWIACLPYAMMGREPSFDAMNSRHQLLLAPGTALLVVAVFEYFLKRKRIVQQIAYSLLLGTFIGYNFKGMTDYQADWFKQLSIMHHLKENDEIRASTFVLVADSARALNAKGRIPLFNEYSAMTKEVYGDETRFITSNLNDTVLIDEFKNHPEYKFTQYINNGKRSILYIYPGKFSMNLKSTCQMLVWKTFDKERFSNAIKEVVYLNAKPLKSGI